MVTKSQLKKYFETGKIPTQAQFGALIDFIFGTPTEDQTTRPNMTLRLGDGDDSKPIIDGLRICHYVMNDDNIYNYWIFTNSIYQDNDAGISIPLFVIRRTSDRRPNLSVDSSPLEYYIPTEQDLTNWVQQGIDCDSATDSEIHHAMSWRFVEWGGGSGSNKPNIINICYSVPAGEYHSYICVLGYANIDGQPKQIPVQITVTLQSAGDEQVRIDGVYDIRSQPNFADLELRWGTLVGMIDITKEIINTSDSEVYDVLYEIIRYYMTRRNERGL